MRYVNFELIKSRFFENKMGISKMRNPEYFAAEYFFLNLKIYRNEFFFPKPKVDSDRKVDPLHDEIC